MEDKTERGLAEEEEKERRLGCWDPAQVPSNTDSLPCPTGCIWPGWPPWGSRPSRSARDAR